MRQDRRPPRLERQLVITERTKSEEHHPILRLELRTAFKMVELAG